ncbi:MAG: RagB/SusD family nutrient uptake outer membrane protein [Bacteroidales bacterium]|nr:RagB/SusD family nutrient uptake outer membrane protein [Bacteroidales bacterium]MBQ9723422.1 RagB/SusD family nutrient uptake outer membrane protein [Bacteroidales bacterium]
MRKIMKLILLSGLLMISSCTNLDETIYDQVSTENYYNTRMDVTRAVFRPFEHAYWSVCSRQVLQELSSDLVATWKKDDWWEDGGRWSRLHYHTWTIEDGEPKTEWDGCFVGVMQCNYVIDDLNVLNPADFGFTDAEFENLKAQCRTLRAWFYLRLLDSFRNVPLAVSRDASLNSEGQVAPEVLFEFIEAELKDCLELLQTKSGAAGNGTAQGQWNKAGAAALLVRLYLNAETYIGESRLDDCARYARAIIDGEYGSYALGKTWDEVYDWQNENCPEVIFAFPSAKGYSHYVYSGDMFWWTVPARTIANYFGDTKAGNGDHNCKYGLAPSLAPDGTPYTTVLGRPVAKMKKYPEDYRLKLYRNLGGSTREGMMLFGYLEYEEGGKIKKVVSPTGGYDLYLRDMVGQFGSLGPDEVPSDKTSNMLSGDHNSGWRYCKYPFYRDDDEGQMESDYVEIRLAEIYYSLAECLFREGKVNEAAELLNAVRRRNYPAEFHADYLYAPEGSAVLDENELLDEWGREFLSEGRRRTDLIRFGCFTSGTWWDKQPDADGHTEIFPLHRDVLSSNPALKQNPGYPEI